MNTTMEPSERVAERREPISERGFRFASGDVELLSLVYTYRLLRRDHIAALSDRDPKRIHRRIKKLLDNRFLKRIALPQEKHVYYLGPAAFPVLIKHGVMVEEDVKRSREHELKDTYFLNHELMLATVHAMLELAGRSSPIQLVLWRQGPELYDSVFNGRESLPVRPDAFFTLHDTRRPDGENKRSFFLECDRSTMTGERMAIKFRAYERYIKAGHHTKRYGIQSVRALTITETTRRAENLSDRAQTVVDASFWKFFLFGTLEGLSLEHPQGILEAIFFRPQDARAGKRYPLIPALAGTQAHA